MSLRRLAATTAVMAAVAALLLALTPGLPDPSAATDPQAFVDAHGPDAVVAAAAAGLAWVAWGWGALGLLLTALSATPGLVGVLARTAGRLLLPASARRAAAVALGVGLTVGAPVLSACSAAPEPVAAVASLPSAVPVPDWPTARLPSAAAEVPAPPPVPEWPAGTPEHVVVRGDCLWDIAAADLRTRTGGEPAASDVARAVAAWWSANAGVIGPDPDLLLPGQVLRAPAGPTDPDPLESETQR